jgi:hypothetical protein
MTGGLTLSLKWRDIVISYFHGVPSDSLDYIESKFVNWEWGSNVVIQCLVLLHCTCRVPGSILNPAVSWLKLLMVFFVPVRHLQV